MLRYVALGDYHTAVGFLLASGPESTARYYRNALCTLAMSFACGTQQAQPAGGGAGAAAPIVRGPGGDGGAAAAAAGANVTLGTIEDATARTLFSQAAKVITANVASVGDSLLGVPLLCSTGQCREGPAAQLNQPGSTLLAVDGCRTCCGRALFSLLPCCQQQKMLPPAPLGPCCVARFCRLA